MDKTLANNIVDVKQLENKIIAIIFREDLENLVHMNHKLDWDKR